MPTIDPNTPAGVQPNISGASGYTLAFSDEFASTALDPKWQLFIDFGNFAAPSNWDVNASGNSAFRIWPQAPSYPNFTMRSTGSPSFANFTYGVWEARVKLCRGRGIFPAFWAYKHPDANPQAEIDIFEAYGYDGGGWNNGAANGWRPTNAAWTIWRDGGGPPTVQSGTLKLSDAGLLVGTDLSADYHVYTLKWEASGLTFYIDGVQWGSKTSSIWTTAELNGTYGPCAVVFDLWFRLAGLPEPDSTNTPSGPTNSMAIDYVRVWNHPGVAPQPVSRIMPMGDSLTEGQSSTLNYRNRLSTRFTNAGLSATFVGSMTSNSTNLPTGRKNHEGHSGWCATDANGICQQGNSAWDSSRPIGVIERVQSWVQNNSADYVLLLIGLNDADKDALPARITSIVNTIHAVKDTTQVLVSGIRQVGNSYTSVNSAIATAVNSLPAARYVSAYAGISDLEFADSLHLNQSGYEKMADNWFTAMTQSISFTAAVTQAPASSAVISGIVFMEVAGALMQNVELVSTAGSGTVYARFNIGANGESATLNWNTASLSNGAITARILAYNVPPGSTGSVVTAMDARVWTISNVSSSELPVLTSFDIGF